MTRDRDRLERCQVPLSGTLLDALRTLDRGQVQIAFAVDQDHRVAGTLTDGDVRRALLGGEPLESPLAPHASREFVRVGPDARRADVLDLMQAQGISQIPILDERGRLAGLHLLREIIGAVERPNWAVIMAGGKGTRLRPLTEHVPKAMIPVAGRPILDRLVLHLVGFGIRRIFLAVNYLSEVIERHFGDGGAHGCRIEYLRESKPLGTGGALSLLRERPDHPLLVLNGDLVAQFDVQGLFAFHAAGGYAATVAIHQHAYTVPFGVVVSDGEKVTAIREKPTVAWRTNAGIYVIEPRVLDRVPTDTELGMPALIERCLEQHDPVGAFTFDGDWIDVGHPKELDRARGRT